ncbi:histone-lysine N-methyltransferase SETMAR [Trichonephila clavipes]|nr:histone-lysine N-methyltransferase SETMAR [Trichonephila clavipes]
MGAEFLFMDDHARYHHANIVDECLQSEDITRMDWAAYSTDLNPIEHVWDMLSRLIAARIFKVKVALRSGRPVIENVDKITEKIEVDRHVSSRSITQELKIDHKTVLSDLKKVGFKKNLDVWVPHQLSPKNNMDRIFLYEALAKRMKSAHFLSGW